MISYWTGFVAIVLVAIVANMVIEVYKLHTNYYVKVAHAEPPGQEEE